MMNRTDFLGVSGEAGRWILLNSQVTISDLSCAMRSIMMVSVDDGQVISVLQKPRDLVLVEGVPLGVALMGLVGEGQAVSVEQQP